MTSQKLTNLDGGQLIDAARRSERRGNHAQARAAYENALRTRSRPADVSAAALLRWIGNTHRAQGDREAAHDCYMTSLKVAELHNSPADMAHALNWMANLEQERGAVDEAIALYSRAEAHAERGDDRRVLAMIGQNLGTLATVQGHHGLAIRHFRRSLQCYRAFDDDEAIARLLNNLGVLQTEMKAWRDAVVSFDEAAAAAERVHDRSTRAMVEVNRTDLWFRQGDLERALRCCHRARDLANRVDHAIALGEAYKWYGIIYREMGDHDIAETHLAAACEVAQRYENVLLAAEIQRERALLYRAQDRNHAALQALNDAHQAFTQLRARRMLQDLDEIVHQIEQIFLDIVRHWGDSIERKDHYTAGHCQRVADYGCMLARAAGVDEKTLVWFRMGAFLHDVGKTAIPAEILNKRGPLMPEERRVMERHTIIGIELLSAIEFPWDIRPMVRGHHEHWDGTGYPDRLAGEDIPLSARILCVADVYDALTTTRAYRPAYSREAALEIMRADAGRVFDPALMQIFDNLLTGRARTTSAA